MNALKKARTEKQLTQKEASDSIGISYSMLSKMELGLKTPSKETMLKVANFYGKTIDSLFFADSVHA